MYFHRYHLTVHGVLLVYSIDRKWTFDNLQDWLVYAKSHIDPNVVVMLVGNKCDCESSREVTTQEALDFANGNAMSFYETSAKESINVDTVFNELLRGVCVCVCVCVCVRVCVCVWVSVLVCMYMWACVCMHGCWCLYACTCYVCMGVRICLCTWMLNVLIRRNYFHFAYKVYSLTEYLSGHRNLL